MTLEFLDRLAYIEARNAALDQRSPLADSPVAVKAYDTQYHSHDVLIVGAGGSGLRAAIAAAESGADVAVLSKVPPTRSHTVAAQGGINAALGNVTPDDWRWHMYDTVRGSDWLGDQDAIAFMCREAPTAVRELEKMGVPFSRDENGLIYQRPYGGMSTDYGKGDMAFRACAAADRTGDAMMQGLYGYVQRYPVHFFVEFIALDLLMAEDGSCRGAAAWELSTGKIHVFLARHTILATGGYGQVYASTTASSTCSGDGNAMVVRAGLPLQDMEYVQFHPTGLHKVGILISEAARGEGGVLRNVDGERFMERYAPKYKDLASRDVVTRAIMQEIEEGRGCGTLRDHVHLDLTALDPAMMDERLPGTRSLAKQFAGVDVMKQLIPVEPTVHYAMGGIPATLDCEVQDAAGRAVPGLYAIGEAACNSVHGANRLGCNSLLDLVVFGKHAGEQAAKEAGRAKFTPADVPQASLAAILAHFDNRRQAKGDIEPHALRHAIQATMQRSAGIRRDEESLAEGEGELRRIAVDLKGNLRMCEPSLEWNNALVTAIEAENLLWQAIATLSAARWRTESRGAHFRRDYPERDDVNWLAHTLVSIDRETATASCEKKAVRMDPHHFGIEQLPPEMRKY